MLCGLCFCFFHADFSQHSTLSDVKSHHFAKITTSDPSVVIDLSFEVSVLFYHEGGGVTLVR